MAGLFSPANTQEQDEAVAIAIAGPVRLTLERLTREQVMEVLYWLGYCSQCGKDLKGSDGKIHSCRCTREIGDL
jgi:hypothetical protein